MVKQLTLGGYLDFGLLVKNLRKKKKTKNNF